MKYSTFRSFMKAEAETLTYPDDSRIQFERILFGGTVKEAEFIAEYCGRLYKDRLGTDDGRRVEIMSRSKGRVELQGPAYVYDAMGFKNEL